MILHTEIIDSYLKGENLDKFKDFWIYSKLGEGENKGKNIFTMPLKENVETVGKIYDEVKRCLYDFKPFNSEIWDLLFPDYRDFLGSTNVYIIVGLPEPHDATVTSDEDGKNVIIFDLNCWVKYYGKMNIENLVRNLVTHESCHMLIGKAFDSIDSDYENGTYLEKMNSLVFNEGFAHLVSYSENINKVDWHEKKLLDVKQKSLSTLRKAFLENNISKQNEYLYNAMYGKYYDKFGCMAGLLYLVDIYTKRGKDGLSCEFHSGYKNIISRILNYYK